MTNAAHRMSRSYFELRVFVLKHDTLLFGSTVTYRFASLHAAAVLEMMASITRTSPTYVRTSRIPSDMGGSLKTKYRHIHCKDKYI